MNPVIQQALIDPRPVATHVLPGAHLPLDVHSIPFVPVEHPVPESSRICPVGQHIPVVELALAFWHDVPPIHPDAVSPQHEPEFFVTHA